ncbi:hypothetical protein HK098_008255 [Nowakowskiella sp. JEL0407]|nr:hypothetical protein HK098_008255 [Nowakowskiella sp. JEL0407]
MLDLAEPQIRKPYRSLPFYKNEDDNINTNSISSVVPNTLFTRGQLIDYLNLTFPNTLRDDKETAIQYLIENKVLFKFETPILENADSNATVVLYLFKATLTVDLILILETYREESVNGQETDSTEPLKVVTPKSGSVIGSPKTFRRPKFKSPLKVSNDSTDSSTSPKRSNDTEICISPPKKNKFSSRLRSSETNNIRKEIEVQEDLIRKAKMVKTMLEKDEDKVLDGLIQKWKKITNLALATLSSRIGPVSCLSSEEMSQPADKNQIHAQFESDPRKLANGLSSEFLFNPPNFWQSEGLEEYQNGDVNEELNVASELENNLIKSAKQFHQGESSVIAYTNEEFRELTNTELAKRLGIESNLIDDLE